MKISTELYHAITMAQKGDPNYFTVIYNESINFVGYRAYSTMKNHDLALDLVQETYIICYQNIHKLKNIDAFYSWIAAIVYKQGMKIFNSSRELLLEENQMYLLDKEIDTAMSYNPELFYQESETRQIIKNLIYDLPESQKTTLLAFYFDGLKIEQIANMMNCSANTVKSRLYYARNSLKDSIKAAEDKYGYRLHAIAFPILCYAFKFLSHITLS